MPKHVRENDSKACAPVKQEKDILQRIIDCEEKYRQLFDSMPDPFTIAELIYDANGKPVDLRFLEVNLAQAKPSGKTREEMIGHTAKEIFGTVEDYWFETYDKVIKTGVSSRYENYAAAPDAYLETYEWKVGENRIGIISRRITDRKKAEEEVARAASFPALNPNAIIELDFNGNIYYANPSSKALFPDLEGKGINHPFLSDWQNVKKAFKGKSSGTLKREVNVRNRWYYQELFLVPNSQCVRIYAIDITERKKAQENLQFNEERFRFALANSPIVVATLDRNFRYTWVYNPLGGFKPEDILGKKVGLSVDSGVSLEIREYLNKVLTNGEKVSWEATSKTIDGEKLFETHAEPLRNPEGEITGVSLVSIDISERKKAEIAHRTSEAKFTELFRNSPIAVTLTRLIDGKIIDANHSAIELMGFTREEAIGKTVLELGIWANPAERVEFVQILKAKGFVSNQELVLQRKDGNYVNAIVSVSSVNIENEPNLITSVVDITDRKKAEQELIEAKNRLQIATDAARLGIHDYDIINNSVHWDKYIRDLWGVSVDESITYETFISGIHPDDQKAVQAEMDKALSPKTGHFYAEYRVINRKSGAVLWVATTGKTFFEHSKPIRLIGTAQDITQRKKAEEALKESKELFSKAFHSISFPVSLMQLSDNQFVDVNDAFLETLEYSREEVIGYTSKELNLFPNYEERQEYVRLLVKQENVRNKQIDMRTKLGKILNVLFSIELLNISGQQHMLTSFVDVTGQKRLEKEVHAYTKKLESLVEQRTKQLKESERLAAIGATAGMVGHDIRNPLQAIINDLYLAEQELKSASENKCSQNVIENLASIHDNILYINKIVADLQDYAKPIIAAAQHVDLRSLCEEALFKNDLLKNIEAVCEVEDEAAIILSDSNLLKRILSNLTMNAVQAMPNGGKLAIRAYKNNDDLIITVKDTGIGIPEDAKDKLFTPMFTTKSKGQGFGLAVVKRMTEALGGNVTYESKVGKGTTFILCFPKINDSSSSRVAKTSF